MLEGRDSESTLATPGVALLRLLAGAAVYGAVLGSWNGPRLAVYAAIKLPLLLTATALLVAPFSVIVARACGLALGASEIARLGLLSLSNTALLLASLAPVAALFTWAAPPPGTAARTAHNLLYLMHTAVVGACGLAGMRGLYERLRRSAPSAGPAAAALVAWVGLYAFVGGEAAWALRPFVGSVYEPIAFVRRDALDGNVYELIWTDIRPHLVEQLTAGETP